MNTETTRVPEDALGSLKSCMLDGDPAQQQATSKIRRRAIFFSVAFQTLAVAALFVFPLLGKGERIPIRIFVERPPYRLGSAHPTVTNAPPTQPDPTHPCFTCKGPLEPSKPNLPNGNASTPGGQGITGEDDGPEGSPVGTPFGNDTPLYTNSAAKVEKPREMPPRISVSNIDPSRLTHRIEPHYPPICVQLHRETRVELQAVISTDGSIQSLQVISGDPLFYQSALDAVRQWQYSPTILNGRAVEVDTHITVIYSLNR